MDLTPEERAAVQALKRLAKKWPKSLWLFSASGTLHVMKRAPDGGQETRKNMNDAYAYGKDVFDQKASVGTIDIPNDGGDW